MLLLPPRAKPVLVTQTLDQLRSAYEQAPADGMNFGELLRRVTIADASASRYGPDFTPNGMCRWPKYIDAVRNAMRTNESAVILDEFWPGVDHRHRCRKCRERLGGLIQDGEGEFGAVMRYGAGEVPEDGV